MEEQLRAEFLEGCPPSSRGQWEKREDLGQALADAWTKVRARVLLEVRPGPFMRFAGARLDARAAVGEARWEELLWCHACLEGVPRSVEQFEALFFGTVDRALARVLATPEARDEARQRVRTTLLGDGSRPPKLGQFTGKGPLSRWLRVLALRTALNVKREYRHEVAVPAVPLESRLAAEDPVVAHMKSTYRRAFERAFADALEQLPAAERVLLHQHYLDGATFEALARLHGLVGTSISRRLEKTRAHLLEAVRRSLGEHLRVSGAEVDSILRLIASSLELPARPRDP